MEENILGLIIINKIEQSIFYTYMYWFQKPLKSVFIPIGVLMQGPNPKTTINEQKWGKAITNNPGKNVAIKTYVNVEI